MSRPKKEDKKTAICLKLHPAYHEYLDNLIESRTYIIEKALFEYANKRYHCNPLFHAYLVDDIRRMRSLTKK